MNGLVLAESVGAASKDVRYEEYEYTMAAMWTTPEGTRCYGHSPLDSELVGDEHRSVFTHDTESVHRAKFWQEPLYSESRPGGSEFISTNSLYVPSLVVLAEGVSLGSTPYDEVSRDRFVGRVMDVANGATVLGLVRDNKSDYKLKFSRGFGLEGQCPYDFTDALRDKYLLVRDVHDIAAHTIQLEYWGEQYYRLFEIMDAVPRLIDWYEFQNQAIPESLSRLQAVSSLAYYAMFEYSVIQDEATNTLTSFGALNWQRPVKTPVAAAIELGLDSFDAHELMAWNGLRAVCSLLRREQLVLGVYRPGSILKNLGYSLDEDTVKRMIFSQYDLSLYRQDELNDFAVSAPKSADELIRTSLSFLEACVLSCVEDGIDVAEFKGS